MLPDSPESQTPASGEPPAESLLRSYGMIMDQQSWQLDTDPEGTSLPPTEEMAPSTPAHSPPADAPVAEHSPAAPPPLVRIVEALLFVGGPPLTAERAAETIRGLTPAQFSQAVDTLNRDYRRQGRPYAIQAQEPGHVLTLRPRYRSVLEKHYGSGREARLSLAAIDVLALVAYRQPATKQEIDTIRGAESGAILRQLVRRGLLAVVNRGEAAQREVKYGTTSRFLELFGLSSIEDLPQTQDLQKL